MEKLARKVSLEYSFFLYAALPVISATPDSEDLKSLLA